MLYRVRKRDIRQAGKVLADAFQHDPLWNKVFDGESESKQRSNTFFEVPVHVLISAEIRDHKLAGQTLLLV